MKTQQEMISHFSKDIDNLAKSKRTVSSNLTLLVIDVRGDPNRSFIFSVWQPTESHLDAMTEGTCLFVQNVIPRYLNH